MRPSVRFPVVAAALLAMACETPVPAARTGEPPAELSTFAVASAPLDTLVTLGAWLKEHPGDVLSDSTPRGVMTAHLCQVARREVLVAKRHIVRSALFTLVDPPADLAIPDDTTRAAADACRLRGVWIESVEPDSLRALALADSVVRLFDATLGAGRDSMDVASVSTYGWASRRAWTQGGTDVVLGIAGPYSGRDEFDRELPVIPRMLVVAATPHSKPGANGWRASSEYYGDDDAEADLNAARLDSAIAWITPSRVADDLRGVVEYSRRAGRHDPARTAATDSALLRAVRAVRDTAPLLDPPQRAAMMLAADLVVQRTAHYLDVDTVVADTRLRTALDSLGLPYDYSPLGAVYSYTGPWLWEAYRTDSAGRAGHEAMLTLLASGWTTKSQCQDGSDQYRAVIEHGEAALRGGDGDPLIHFYVGMAYHDIVALSRPSALDDYVDHAQYVPLAPDARAHAIDHLRKFVASSADRRLRAYAWRYTMSLLTGQVLPTRYFCVYD